MLSNRLGVTQIMMLADQAIEKFLQPGSTYLLEMDRGQVMNRTLYRGSVDLYMNRLSSIGKRILEVTLGRRELDQISGLQQQQQAAADHVFECAVFLPPVPRPAHLLRNEASAGVGMGRYDFSDNVNIRLGNVSCAVCRNDSHAWQYKESKTGTQEKSNVLLKKIYLNQLQDSVTPIY